MGEYQGSICGDTMQKGVNTILFTNPEARGSVETCMEGWRTQRGLNPQSPTNRALESTTPLWMRHWPVGRGASDWQKVGLKFKTRLSIYLHIS